MNQPAARIEQPAVSVQPAALFPCHIVVVGAGGTGGYLVESLGRLLYADRNAPLPTDQLNRLSLTLVDGDVVESNNLLRQNFTAEDLGVNKAQALAQALTDMFAVPVAASGSYIHDAGDLDALATSDGALIVVSCVDNNATRAIIERFVSNRPNTVGIDSGNRVSDGQVIVYGDPTLLGYDTMRRLVSGLEPPRTPLERFPELADVSGLNAHPDDQSCELHAIHAPQNVATNMLAALTCFMVVNRVLHSLAFAHYVYRFDITRPYLVEEA